jgi:ubiquinone/menaquinone biosynthesis C-methylase UbiE
MRKGRNERKLRAVYDRVARRYDFQHGFLTLKSDQRGRRMVVEKTIQPGDRVVDGGAGTGSTSLLAAGQAGPDGRVVLVDQSDGMLSEAENKIRTTGLGERMDICTADMMRLPFKDGEFDAALSTYSLCPLYDPAGGALELYRVIKKEGRLGIAHSTWPEGRIWRRLAEVVEGMAWRFPSVSLGCRAVSVLPQLVQAGARVLFERRIGIPLWPFLVAVVEKPAEEERAATTRHSHGQE